MDKIGHPWLQPRADLNCLNGQSNPAHLSNKKYLSLTFSKMFDHVKDGWLKNVTSSKLFNTSTCEYQDIKHEVLIDRLIIIGLEPSSKIVPVLSEGIVYVVHLD